jgi:hypothetical protein
MFKGSRGVRLLYKKRDCGYDYIQPVILPSGEKVLVYGNTLEGCPIDTVAEVELKRASDLVYAQNRLVEIEGYQPMHVVPNWDILIGYSQLFED